MKTCNVLLSSAGRRVSLLHIFREALHRAGVSGKVFASDVSRLSAAFHSADAGFSVPRCTRPEFIPAMLELCRQQDIRLIIPTIDTELLAYAQARESFERAGVTVAVSSPEVIHLARDKIATHEWLVQQGFPTVRQGTPDALRSSGDWRFPLLVKPRGGSASIGVRIVKDLAQLEAATSEGDYLVQTVAAGVEHTVDFFATREGRCVCTVPRRRFEVRSGEVSKAMTVRSPTLQSLTARLCERLPGAFATLNAQMFWDEKTDEVRIIELNARFGGGYPLAWKAGAPFAEWLVRMATAGGVPDAFDGWKDRLVMLRYDEAVFVDESKTWT
jgi:carbamoyl-phosphate synthase large subunit